MQDVGHGSNCLQHQFGLQSRFNPFEQVCHQHREAHSSVQYVAHSLSAISHQLQQASPDQGKRNGHQLQKRQSADRAQKGCCPYALDVVVTALPSFESRGTIHKILEAWKAWYVAHQAGQ
jgi:hypothetical protein